MAYLKPPTFTRKVFNPLAMRFAIGGSTTLAVRRRSSGTTQQIPVIPVELAGSRYIVSTRGESQWVRNARSSGSVELRRRGHSERFTAVEIPVAERPPVLDAYREKAGKMVGTYWKQLPDPADHPVFRLEPA